MPDTYAGVGYVDVTSATPAYYRLVRVFPVFGVRMHGTVPVSQVHLTSSLVLFWEGVEYSNHVTSAQRSTPALVALQPPNPRQVTPKLQP